MRGRDRHSAHRGRGRPRGSGTRDESMLYEIALRRASDPKVQITSVVKMIIQQYGVPKNTNTVRRVRRKYAEFEPVYGMVAVQYLRAEQYDPNRHAGAPIGTLARVKQDSILWVDMSCNGWHPIQGWKDDEWIIQRDLWSVATPKGPCEDCAGCFAEISSSESHSSPESGDEAPFGF
jgi:hypothetical protein